MPAPLIAIVGRPNVGKSTLFNRLLGHRSAIVHDEPGVTRDRHYGIAELYGHKIQVVDTGGFMPNDAEGMLPLMREQAQAAMDESDIIIFLCNARDGVTAADEEIADVLRRADKPVLLAANKCDSDAVEVEAMALYSLGFERVYAISAAHNRGILDLHESIYEILNDRKLFDNEGSEHLDVERVEEDDAPIRGGRVDRIRVCFVGRPNVGKSTLVNKLLGSDRVITADMPGTTRDAIDIDFSWRGENFTLVDTAGLRRKRSIIHAIEIYSVSQAVRAIERCHLAILVLDASQPLADQDSKIGALIQDRGRACVIAINKWDAVYKDTMTTKAYDTDLTENIPFMSHVPRVFISAKNGQRVEKLFDTVRSTYDNFNRRIGTGEFNRWLQELQHSHQPPTYRGKALRMYYGNQVGVRPPQFVIQVNTLGAISPAYERFLIAQMRAKWELEGSPIRLRLRKKAERRAKHVPGIFADNAPDEEDFTGDDAWFGDEGDDDIDDGDAPGQEWKNPEAQEDEEF